MSNLLKTKTLKNNDEVWSKFTSATLKGWPKLYLTNIEELGKAVALSYLVNIIITYDVIKQSV